METKEISTVNTKEEIKLLNYLLDNTARDQELIKMNEIKEKYFQSNLKENIAKYAVINFILEYNSFKRIWNNKSHKKLGKELIKNYSNIDIIEISLQTIKDVIKDPSPFRALISFRKEIPKEKSYLELYFKLMLLNQNIEHIITGIKNLLHIQNKTIFHKLEKLDLKNPYAMLLERDLINDLILKESDVNENNLLENAILSLNNYLFHCPQCKEILYYNHNKEALFICINQHLFNYNDINSFKNDIEIEILCQKCNNNIMIYEKNYICLNCKKFFCINCFDLHRKENINNVLVDIFNLGYLCNEHFE